MRTPGVAAAACALVLGGCGSHAASHANAVARAGASRSADPAQVAALRTTAQSFWNDLLTGQGPDAYTFLSARCQTIVDVAQFNDLVIRAGNGYAGPPLPFLTFKARIHDEHASVDYTFRIHKLDTVDDRWVQERDGWRWDACDHSAQHPDQGANV
jgi:hypothetical protein